LGDNSVFENEKIYSPSFVKLGRKRFEIGDSWWCRGLEGVEKAGSKDKRCGGEKLFDNDLAGENRGEGLVRLAFRSGV